MACRRASPAGARKARPRKPARSEAQTESDPELQMAKPKPPEVKVIRMPDKFPEQPWKKKS